MDQAAHQTIFVILLGLLPRLLLCPDFSPLLLVRKALVDIHKKDDCDLNGIKKGVCAKRICKRRLRGHRACGKILQVIIS